MLKVKVIHKGDGKPGRLATGRTIAAVAKREFGAKVTVTLVQDPHYNPAVNVHVVRFGGDEVGRIFELKREEAKA